MLQRPLCLGGWRSRSLDVGCCFSGTAGARPKSSFNPIPHQDRKLRVVLGNIGFRAYPLRVGLVLALGRGDSVMGHNEILGVSAVIGLLAVLAGCWRIMRALRIRSSRFLFFSLASLFIWLFISDAIFRIVFYYSDLSHPTPLQNYVYLAIDIFVPALLILCASASFWFVARSVSRPDNSFKPNPHQSGA
jgi:hypothetical protein